MDLATADIAGVQKWLREKHGWNPPVPLSDKKRQLFRRDLGELKAELSLARRKLEDERAELRQNLETNMWVSATDRTEVLVRHETKIKLLHEVEKNLGITERNLEEPEKGAQ